MRSAPQAKKPTEKQLTAIARRMSDQKYVEARNRLIPQAEKEARKKAGPEPARKTTEWSEWAKDWNLGFHTEMERLVRHSGIRRAG